MSIQTLDHLRGDPGSAVRGVLIATALSLALFWVPLFAWLSHR